MNVKVHSRCKPFLHFTFIILHFTFIISSCSVSKHISKQANTILLEDTAISKGHIGISIYEPATGKYWYNYNADKYFVPCSNTKLFTLYAGMKYLGDSLLGMRYYQSTDTVYVLPTGDPTFMHPDFTNQPVAVFFKEVHSPTIFSNENWKAEKYGKGWAWDDYNDDYMAERNAFPVYGNVFKTEFNKHKLEILQPQLLTVSVVNKVDNSLERVIIKRKQSENGFEVSFPDKDFSFQKDIPFVTNGITTTLEILHSTFPFIQPQATAFKIQNSSFKIIKTQPTDSLFKPMMHNSDNFFAEQTLLMVSNERLGYMSDEDMIDTLLKTDLKDVPQKPKWVDGSGLSRYNLFTPKSFIYILEKMKNEFGLERLKNILPTGAEGTLKNYFKNDAGYIFAKTGSLSNNCALSGFLITKNGNLLVFSVLVNNYQTGAAPVRSAVEHFLLEIRKKY